jgi:3-phosphoshikimate 1-carboxyvinyltransferase
MDLTVTPGGAIYGEAALPGDKSLSHRAALFASLAYGESRFENFLVSGVTKAMLDSLTLLGVPWQLSEKTLIVQGRGLQGYQVPRAPLNCGGSATTLRLLAGALAASGIAATLDGSPGLRRRPMDRITGPLRQMGLKIEDANGCAPLLLQPAALPLKALDYTLPVASAQVKTCLLLAALAADGPTLLHEPELSRDHSERMLQSMGITVSSQKETVSGRTQFTTRIQPANNPFALKPLALTLPGDFSAAAFLIVAALITPGSNLTLRDVGLNATRTGLLDALLEMGANICISRQTNRGGEAVGDLTILSSSLHGISIGGDQVVRMIDEFPVFAAAAAFASGETHVQDAAELRVKESDRITALSSELRRLGVPVSERPDGFSIQGGAPLRGGRVDPHGDHRLAMSLAVMGLASQAPVTIQNAEIMAESFPEFTGVLQKLGADVGLKPEAAV